MSDNLELFVEAPKTKRHGSLETALLQGAPKALDDGNGAVLSDRTKARLDAVLFEPIGVDGSGLARRATPKLTALVGDDVAWSVALSFDSDIESGGDLSRRRLLSKRQESQDLPRRVVLDSDHLVSKGKDGRKLERTPGNSDAKQSRYDSDVDMPQGARLGVSDAGPPMSMVALGKLE